MTAQLSSRLYPIVDIDAHVQRDGGNHYSVADIWAIVRNRKLKILTPAAATWLMRLANVGGKTAYCDALGV